MFVSNEVAAHSNERTVELPLIQRRLPGWTSMEVTPGVNAIAAGRRLSAASVLTLVARIGISQCLGLEALWGRVRAS
jgi:hypothetical protein